MKNTFSAYRLHQLDPSKTVVVLTLNSQKYTFSLPEMERLIEVLDPNREEKSVLYQAVAQIVRQELDRELSPSYDD